MPAYHGAIILDCTVIVLKSGSIYEVLLQHWTTRDFTSLQPAFTNIIEGAGITCRLSSVCVQRTQRFEIMATNGDQLVPTTIGNMLVVLQGLKLKEMRRTDGLQITRNP